MATTRTRACAVDQQCGPGLDAHRVQGPGGGLHGHRQDGGRDGIEPVRYAVPAVENRDVGDTGARLSEEVRRPEDEVSDRDVADMLTHSVDHPGDVVADAARQAARHESAAEFPVGRVQSDRSHPHADAAGRGVGNLDTLLAQYVGRFAVLVKADCSSGNGAHRFSSQHTVVTVTDATMLRQ